MVPGVGVEPTRAKVSQDFKSCASANSATRAFGGPILPWARNRGRWPEGKSSGSAWSPEPGVSHRTGPHQEKGIEVQFGLETMAVLIDLVESVTDVTQQSTPLRSGVDRL